MSQDNVAPYAPAKVPEERPGQEGGRRHQNRLARTRDLCEAAKVAFLERGLDAVTIDDIVLGAGVSKGSFYRYFDNKEALVAALFDPISSRVITSMSACAQALDAATNRTELQPAYGQLAAELVEVVTTDAPLVQLFLQERHGPESITRAPILDLDRAMVEAAVHMTHAARSNGLLRQVDAKVSAVAVVGAVLELLWQTFKGRGPADPVAASQQLIDIVLHGVSQPR